MQFGITQILVNY